MFDQVFRAFKDWLLAPLARVVGPRLSPNVISVIAFVAGLGAAGAVLGDRNSLALALWIANRILDGFDGTQARVHHTQSDFGGYLDIVFDFVVYAAIPLSIAMTDRTAGIPVAVAVLLATFFVNGASWMYLAAILERRQAGAEAHGELTTITMPPGIVAGAETVVFYSLFLAIPRFRVTLIFVMATLVSANVVQRLWWARRRI